MQRELMAARYWGEVTIRFQGGSIVLLEKKETFKPGDFTRFEAYVEELRVG